MCSPFVCHDEILSISVGRTCECTRKFKIHSQVTTKVTKSTCYWFFLEIHSGKNRIVSSYLNWTLSRWLIPGLNCYRFRFWRNFFAQDPQEFVITTNISYLLGRKYRVGMRKVMSYFDTLIEMSSTENFNFPMPIIEFMIHQTDKKLFKT